MVSQNVDRATKNILIEVINYKIRCLHKNMCSHIWFAVFIPNSPKTVCCYIVICILLYVPDIILSVIMIADDILYL